MVNLGVIAEDSTTRFYMSTSIATGAAADMSASLEQADFVIMKDGAAMTLDASSIIPTNITVGIYEIDIDTSVDADFTKGSTYWVYFAPSDETLDSVDVAAVLGCFTIESASEQAIRRLRENIAITDTLTTQTGVSDNTAVNLTGIVDAQSANDLFNGWLGLLKDETDGQCYLCRINDFTNTNLLASITSATGATLPTPANGDKFWLLGAAPLMPTVPGRTLDTGASGGVALQDDAITAGKYDQSTAFPMADANGTALTEAGGTGDHLTAINLPNQTMDIVGNITGNLSGSVGSVATGGIAAASFAAGAVDAAALAADAGTELGTAVWASATRTLTAIDEDSTTLDIDAAVRAAVGLASANLDTQLGDLPTNAELSTALAAADDAVLAAIAALNNLSAAQVNAEALDVIATDTRAEPGQGTPGATISLAAKIDYLYKAWRNRSAQTATTHSLYNDDATTVDQKRTVSDDGTTFGATEVTTGP